VQRFKKVLIAAGRASQHQQQCEDKHKERDHRSGSGSFLGYFGGFYPLRERRRAMRFKASAVAIY
jgi:hypothetical protein